MRMERTFAAAKRYTFQAPPLLTRDEYRSFKAILQADPGFRLAPPMPLTTAFPVLAFLIDCLRGRLRSLMQFRRFHAERKRYFRNMKSVIMSSRDYEDYLRRIVRI